MPPASNRRRSVPAWSLLVLWLAAPDAVRAQPGRPTGAEAPALSRPDAPAEARRQFMLGERLFRAGRYREAARAYQRGYRLSGRPGFLINIAHCQVRLGRPELAREQYRRFLAQAPDAPHAAEVARALADLDAQESKHQDARTPLPEIVTTPSSIDTPPLPLGTRDRLHQPSAAEMAMRLPPPAPVASPPRWLWPVVGVAAAAVVTGTVALFVARDQRSAPLSRGSIGTIRQ